MGWKPYLLSIYYLLWDRQRWNYCSFLGKQFFFQKSWVVGVSKLINLLSSAPHQAHSHTRETPPLPSRNTIFIWVIYRELTWRIKHTKYCQMHYFQWRLYSDSELHKSPMPWLCGFMVVVSNLSRVRHWGEGMAGVSVWGVGVWGGGRLRKHVLCKYSNFWRHNVS